MSQVETVLCAFYCDVKICYLVWEHFHFFICDLSCFGWRGEESANRRIYHSDMFTSDGFYLAHVYYIIHNRIPIMKWMNVTVHSKQMHIR